MQIDEVGGEEVDAAEPAHSLQTTQQVAPTNTVATEKQVKDKVSTAPPGN